MCVNLTSNSVLFLFQIDVLEHSSVTNVIILQTVLDEVLF